MPRLLRGEAVVRWREASGPDKIGLGERCAVVRADLPAAVQQLHAKLRRPAHETPRLLVCSDTPWVPSEAEGCVEHGTFAIPVPAEFAHLGGPDRRCAVQRARAGSPLDRMLQSVRVATGHSALAATVLADGDGAICSTVGDVVSLWRRHSLGALLVPGAVLERAP